ncbi:2Fe-2S iron-sulfur cluster-binding protein [Halobacteriovorax sp. JY17]|uniref:2Fe-2S iron-sulfur cluster-binding protein n=1 Tax=Halobacteriovorax sp. JY17 TaxID=2014617 RepID=UPI000C5EA018|nr:2Fe-2S iron-sulfur cluster-binding protein [Halobacteriovorax sp. JY17]PIK15762.1 MAG: ferredoxin [Halobacteriovorax sp. JY17]
MSLSKIKIKGIEEELEVESGKHLSELLTASNSPILFGCRTGICGTCLIRVHDGKENINPPCADEAEFLEIVAEGDSKMRLACKVIINGNINIEYIGK